MKREKCTPEIRLPTTALTARSKKSESGKAFSASFPAFPRGEKYVALWEEFEKEETEEARFVKQMESLEMALQAVVYEHDTGKNLQEFFDYVSGKLTLPELQTLFNEIESTRRQR